LGQYLTDEIRELTGAKTVVVVQCLHKTGKAEHSIVTVNPHRRQNIIESPQFESLIDIAHNLEDITWWHQKGDSGKAEEILAALGLGLSIAIPLHIGDSREGVILLFDLPQERHIEQVIEMLRTLCPVVALILRNSFLYTQQENIISERTTQLRESEKKYRQVTEGIETILWEYDLLKDSWTYVSPQSQRLLGYAPQEWTGLSFWTEHIHEDDRKWASEYCSECVARGESHEFEYRFLKKNGDVVWLRDVVNVELNGDKPIKMRGFMSDITERKQAEDKLKESEKRSWAYLEYSPACTKIVDLDFNLQYMSRAGVVGLKIDDITEFYGKPYPFYFYPESFKNCMTKNLEKVRETGEITTQEASVVDIDGNELWFHSTLVPVNDDEGQIEYIMVVSIEITERKQAEEQREKLVKILEYKNKELRDIVYTTSHDLKSPLVNIEGFSGELIFACDNLLMLLADQDKGEDKRPQIETLLKDNIPESLKYITGSTKKMASLLDGLLQISRVGTVEIKSESIDMNKTMGEVLAAMEHQIKEYNITVTIETLADCVGDPNMLDHVFANLISNAIKYRDPAKESEVRISCEVEDGMSIYCVEDNGIGIAPDYQNKVFEIFHRLNPKEDVEGQGLGLTIVTRIMDRLAGKIWLESEEGKGSKFFIALPTT
jgi:PAS domain S-box-containing protein